MTEPSLAVVSTSSEPKTEVPPSVSSAALEAMQKMQAAQVELNTSSLEQRIGEVGKIRDAMLADREACTTALMQACGKTRTDATIEFLGTLDWLKWLEKNAQKQLQTQKVRTPLMLLGKKSRIIHEPLGVTLIITPWNYPLHTGITQIMTAFTCGNAVIYKPSEITPLKGIYESLFSHSEWVSKSVCISYGDGNHGRELINTRPEKIFFTGSTKTGKAIARQAADYLIPVDLELGGKDPMIVFPSANLERAVAAATWGGFTHNGQSCSAVERLYVHQSIYSEFVSRLTESVNAMVQKLDDEGDADLGRLTVGFQYDIAKRHIDDAIAKGAKVECGNREIDRANHMMAPTVLTNVNDGMAVMKEETFGPVLPVIPFTDEAEAVYRANQSNYGLQASVFSDSIEQAERVAAQLEVGGVSINNVNMVEGNPWLSFGGRKDTGWGRARGVKGLLAYTRSKHILIDPNTKKIEANWNPYTPGKYKRFVRLINATFSRSPLSLLKFIVAGLTLESYSQKKRSTK